MIDWLKVYLCNRLFNVLYYTFARISYYRIVFIFHSLILVWDCVREKKKLNAYSHIEMNNH